MPTVQSPFCLERERHWAHIAPDERSRQEALLELVMTEQSYYERLTILHQVSPASDCLALQLCQVFFQPSAEFIATKDRQVIFQNLDELLLRSGLFLSDLRRRQIQGNGVIAGVSDIVLEHLKSFDCFRVYCMGHAEGSRHVHKLTDSSSKFARFLKTAANDPRSCSLDLASYLLEPVQRLARYPLLLKQILHFTDKSLADHGRTLEAVRASETLLQQVNEAVRRHESQLRLTQVQSRLVQSLESDDDVGLELVGMTKQGVPRMLLLEAELCKCRSKRKLLGLLLTDMIVLLEADGSKYRLYRQPLSFTEIVLRAIDFEATPLKLASGLKKECTFEILRGAESICLASETVGERQKWLQLWEEARQSQQNAQSRLLAQQQPLSLPCIGTIRITLLSGSNIPGGIDSFGALTLNNQHVELRPAPGSCPVWAQSEVLCLSSYDDYLRVSLFHYHKFAPNELLGQADLSLNFLEYYNERATQRMELDLGGPAIKIALTLQYHAL